MTDQSNLARHSREDGNPVINSSETSQSPSKPIPLIAIVGETASGKTSVAIELAERVNGEVICADSRTIYKCMDIGTAKPTQKEQREVKHHLIDVIEPDKTFNVAQFKLMAEKCIQDIGSRDKVPILVGGTGLYIDAVLYNFQFTKPANPVLRTRLEQMSDVELTTLLNTKNIDTTTLNTKNRRHVIRAIERDGEVVQNKILRKNTIVLGLKLEKELLNQRIAKRVEKMFRDGYMKEVNDISIRYGWDVELLSGIGYDVIQAYSEGRSTEEEAKNALILRDIGLAKRQRTWFKRSSDIEWFDDSEKLVDRAAEFIDGSMGH